MSHTRGADSESSLGLGYLGEEGLRVFWPLAALHAGIWPLLGVAGVPLLPYHPAMLPPGLWHGSEMIYGTFGAALIGFLTSAVPEWTGIRRPRGAVLFVLAGAWLAARLAALIGEAIPVVVVLAGDAVWLLWLLVFLVRAAVVARAPQFAVFVLWIGTLAATMGVSRTALLVGDVLTAQAAIHLGGLAFLGLLGVALAKINLRITTVLRTGADAAAPAHPHPVRMGLATALMAVLVVAELIGTPLAAGIAAAGAAAAFIDRALGPAAGGVRWRAELLLLRGAGIFASAGLVLFALNRWGFQISEIAALHLAFMGGLGLAVLAVFAIAGVLHTGGSLPLTTGPRVAGGLLTVAVVARVLPDMAPNWLSPMLAYALSAGLWTGAFALWFVAYVPRFLRRPVGKHADPRTEPPNA